MQTLQICKKCNNQLSDGANFCEKCGAAIEKTTFDTQTMLQSPPENSEDLISFAKTPDDSPVVTAYPAESTETLPPPLPAETAAVSSQPSLKIPRAAVIALVAIVLICVAAAVFPSLGGSDALKIKNLVYIKDGELFFSFISDLKPIEITDDFSGELSDGGIDIYTATYFSAFIKISNDDRYVFYPDRIENGSYCSYYWKDLKNKDSAVKIDSDIYEIVYFDEDGSEIIYLKGDDNNLYIYDRKKGEKSKLASDIDSCYINDNGDYLIFDTYEDGEYTLYEMTVKNNTGEKTKIDSNSRIEKAYPNDKKVFYLKNDSSLYLKDAKKEKEKIASDVMVLSVINGEFVYYVKSEEVSVSLANLINDDLLQTDQTLTMPEYPVLPEEPAYPTTYDFEISEWIPSEHGNEVNENGERGYRNYKIDYDAYYAALENYEEERNEWWDICDALETEYYDALSFYNSKVSRDSLREALSDESNSVSFIENDLYFWTASNSTLVAENISGDSSYYPVLSISYSVPIVAYKKSEPSGFSKTDLSALIGDGTGYFDISSIIWELEAELSSSYDYKDGVFVACKDKENFLDIENYAGLSISENGVLYYMGDYNDDKQYADLMTVKITNGILENPEKIDEDVSYSYLNAVGESFYYLKDIKNDSGDLYKDGKMIASDVYILDAFIWNNTDSLLYYTDYSEKNQTGTLNIYSGGKQTKIADDVHYYVPLSEKSVAYITNFSNNRSIGDLMLYDKNKSVTVDNDVSALIIDFRILSSASTYY